MRKQDKELGLDKEAVGEEEPVIQMASLSLEINDANGTPAPAADAAEPLDPTAGLSKKARQKLKKRAAGRGGAGLDEDGYWAESLPVSSGAASPATRETDTPESAAEDATPAAAAAEEAESQPAKGRKSRRNKKDAAPGGAAAAPIVSEAHNNATAATLTTKAQTCNVCSSSFDSKSKLFRHVEETGHARAASAAPEDDDDGPGAGGRKGNKKKGRRRE
jgi:DnaJ family protein A protein 5